MPDKAQEKETVQMRRNDQEKAILRHIASLLTREELITPDEQLRFLTLLKEEA